jgi:hypothetical protein
VKLSGWPKAPARVAFLSKRESQYTRRKLRSGEPRREEAYMVAIVEGVSDFNNLAALDECYQGE